jgi:hypothetical protein
MIYHKAICLLLFLGVSAYAGAQVVGKVTNAAGEPLPFVNIYIEGTLNGTTTNDAGTYLLPLPTLGEQVIVFKYLGYKTEKRTLAPNGSTMELNMVLQEESVQLAGVELTANENPALDIIRKAIAKRKSTKERLSKYTARFYSKGLIRIQGAPERIMGQDLGDFGGGLDSTRTGIVYLSETFSNIARKGKEFKETIVASKVAGDDSGFSFNAASDVEYSFYDNTFSLGGDAQLVSPIADNALSYYNYRLTGTFYEDGKTLINQIEVAPKRPQDKTFVGLVYIVEDDWSVYAVDLKTTGQQAQIVPVDTFFLKQRFNYSQQHQLWLKVLQSLDFQYSILGFKGDGRFTAAYNDYDLEPTFTKADFTNNILDFEEDANKKDTVYWQRLRPVPLTAEETMDYGRKDSIQVIRKSQPYLDSIDTKGNRFKWSNLLFGYTYSNTFKETYFVVGSPLQNMLFNTVQGWHGSLALDYIKLNKEKGTRLGIGGMLNYGLSDKRLRPTFSMGYRFNQFSRPYLRLRAGNEAVQFNGDEPITPWSNTLATIVFENNFAKFYDRTFAELFHAIEITNGIQGNVTLAYEDRKPLFNTTSATFFNANVTDFTSNNPLDATNTNSAAIVDHTLAKLDVGVRIRFGQKYLSYPDEKINLLDERFPVLYLGYENGFLSNDADNHFHQFKARLAQSFTVADKGRFAYNLRAGSFLNAQAISFVDYQHFNGNETHVTRRDYMDSFFLLPYYALSTNKRYAEGHLEHNFNGWAMNKIPLLRKLNAHLILSGKLLATSDNAPYSEFGIALGHLGIKKFRFLRVGYAQSHFNGVVERGLNIGLTFP